MELGAGQTKELLAGPKAGLLARLQGPDGPVRLPYQVYDQLSGRRVATGYSGNKLRLMPGGYRLELELPPGFSRQISLKARGEPGTGISPGRSPSGFGGRPQKALYLEEPAG